MKNQLPWLRGSSCAQQISVAFGYSLRMARISSSGNG